jgi:hypothetical protein
MSMRVGGDAVRWETVIACEPDPARRRHFTHTTHDGGADDLRFHVWALVARGCRSSEVR